MAHARHFLVLAALLALGSPGLAQEGAADWGRAERVKVDLANFSFTPETINLHHGEAYVIALVNKAGGGHDFVAGDFFAAATMPEADRARLHDGGVELSGGETVELHLIAPAPGSYKAKCSHFMHSSFGMKGMIVVS